MLVSKMRQNESTKFRKSFGQELLRRLAINYERYLVKNGLPPYEVWRKRLNDFIDQIVNLLIKGESRENLKLRKKKRFTRWDYFTWAALDDEIMSFSEWLDSMGLREYLLRQLGMRDIPKDLIDDL